MNSAGMQGEQVILGLMIYRLTESSTWVGLSLALFFAPMLLVGVPAGALADRFDRRTILVITEAALCISLAVFAWCLANGMIGIAGILVMSVLSGTLRSIHHPARLSYAGEIAGSKGMIAALGMLSITTRLGQLAGALTTGAISELTGAGAAYAALAAGHAIALLAFTRTASNRPPHTTAQANAQHLTDSNTLQGKTGLMQRIYRQLVILKSTTTILILVVLASIVEVLGFSFATALPEIAVERLGIGDGGLGTMHSMRAAGGLAGAITLSLINFRQMGTLFILIIAGFGVSLWCLAVAAQLHWVLVTIVFIAFFASITDILVQSMLQICAPPELRGRAMGVWVFALGMGPIGHLELGLLMSIFGTTAALGTNGTLMLLIAVLSWRLFPSLRRVRND